ncbi:hypothetical protein ACH4MU_07465 [Streptomyces albidoflavus]|uniref:hypothetical protein n=1 Tax=Streptomyces TaxID=1883 RepID=UPI000564A871|nr:MULTISPECIES: hypothetical protein [Streptomyces]SCE00937.1 hypothetical protein GA0115236_13225 [Streptomyces sp. IgraMP-1]AMM10765.1 hypothetical protein Salbus254_4303 [Streptomyces albidoflavus]WSD53113.1 hypothetical protein OHA76_10285 [Streptomyces albidoflavus]WTC41783.1 hypothetical protein OH810_09610 [Streptomyces albidoflavus]WTD43795.1 hypothetical protein OH730_20975 [Streptomyces albidoflavus]
MSGAVEYLAETYGGDDRRTVFLGGAIAPTRRLVLRWLRDQAFRLAGGLDPAPDVRWAPTGALRRIPAAVLDAPGALRGWAASIEYQDDAGQLLAHGEPFVFTVRDAAGWYRLTAHPLLVPRAVQPVTAHPHHFVRPPV